jgi:M6 family metalloprotease-like protein
MHTDPTAAAAELLPKSERDVINAMTANCVETPVTITGTTEVSHADDFTNKTDYTTYAVRTTNGASFTLHSVTGEPNLVSNEKVTVTGLKLDSDLLYSGTTNGTGVSLGEVSSDLGSLTVTQAAAAPVSGQQKIAVLLMNFQGTVQPQLTVAQVQSFVATQLAPYYAENSYNKISISADVYGWYMIPEIASCPSTYLDFASAIAAADPYVNFANYNRVLLIEPLGGCPFRGMSSIGTVIQPTNDGNIVMSESMVIATTFEGSPNSSFPDVAHELGHGLGNDHARYIHCGTNTFYESGGCVVDEYGDLYDPMGGGIGNAPSHYNAVHKEYMGWLDATNIQTVTTDGTYALGPIETNSPAQTKRALKIQRGPADYEYIEYRQPIGYDSNLEYSPTVDVFRGVLIHTISGGSAGLGNGSLLVDPTTPGGSTAETTALTLGATVRDPQTGNTVQTISSNASSAQVAVHICKSDVTGPITDVTNITPNQNVTGTLTVQTTVNDPAGINKVQFKMGGITIVDTSAPYEATFDTTHIPNGPQDILVTAWDNAGIPCGAGVPNNITNLTVPVNVANTDTVAPMVSVMSPVSGMHYSGSVPLQANASDNVGIYQLTFCVKEPYFQMLVGQCHPGDYQVNVFTMPPYTMPANFFVNGLHNLYVIAQDYIGNITESDIVTFVTAPSDIVAPTVSITSPLGTGAVSGSTPIVVNNTDNIGVLKLEYYIDQAATPLTTTMFPQSPATLYWDTRTVANGSHTIQVKAYDFYNNTALSTLTTVQVNNSGGVGGRPPVKKLELKPIISN